MPWLSYMSFYLTWNISKFNRNYSRTLKTCDVLEGIVAIYWVCSVVTDYRKQIIIQISMKFMGSSSLAILEHIVCGHVY
jgi:hypothetical protein